MTIAIKTSDFVDAAKADAARSLRLYAGDLSPVDALALVESGKAILVDIRSAEERKALGIAPQAVHVAWQTGPALIKNPRFLKDLAAKAGKDKTLLLICRSGRRSVDAAIAATADGFAAVYNVLEGFSGATDRDPEAIGWIARSLPFVKR